MSSVHSSFAKDQRAALKKKLSQGLICLSLSPIFAGSAFAIDWGHPLMLSKQGERLKIEIPLSALTPEESRGLQVNFAPASTYQSRQLGEDALSLNAIGAQVKLTQNAKGQDILFISSDKPLAQNFISFLLELHWSTGSETKEMGLLLETLTKTKPTSDSAIVVSEGDTASSIAQQLAKAPITYEQMLVALLKNNPKSFINQNINRLRADATLKVPSNAQALSLSPQEAKEELKAQNLDFERYRKSLTQKIQNAKVTAPNASPQSASGLVSPKVQAPSSTSADQLKLSKPGSKSAKASDQVAKELQTKDKLKEADQVKQNLKELGQLADEKAKAPNDPQSPNGLIDAQMPSLKTRISHWLQMPLTPVFAGLLFGFLVLLTLWKTKKRDEDHHGNADGVDPLSRPSSIFDLDTPIPSSLRSRPSPLKPLGGPEPLAPHTDTAPHTETAPERDLPEHSAQAMEDPLDAPLEEGLNAGSLKDHVHIDFDLDLPEMEDVPLSAPDQAPPVVAPQTNSPQAVEEDPLQVRFDLAQELWHVGQHHTARAIVEEVVRQAHGPLLDQCQAWLNERP